MLRLEERSTYLTFMVPAVAVYAGIVVIPVFYVLYIALHRWDGLGAIQFIGLHNFARIAQDPVFWQALRNNITLIAASVLVELPLALGLALAVTGVRRGRLFFRTVLFAPLVISIVASGFLWVFFYNPVFGPLNTLLREIGLSGWARGWLGEPSTALWAVIGTIVWRHAGFHMVLFIAAIETIPEELYEAARVDGASGWRLTRHITLPLLVMPAKIAAILAIVGSLKYFDLIWVMTGGGPAHTTELLATHMYTQTFRTFQMGYGAALASVLFMLAFVVTVLFLAATRGRAET